MALFCTRRLAISCLYLKQHLRNCQLQPSKPTPTVFRPCRTISCSKISFKKTTDQIAASETTAAASESVQLFNENDLFMGKMAFSEAEKRAGDSNMDLDMIGAGEDGMKSYRLANPEKNPHRSEKGSKTKHKKHEKIFKFQTNISDHDLNTKMRKIRQLVSEKDQSVILEISSGKGSPDQAIAARSAFSKKLISLMEDFGVISQMQHSEKAETVHLKPKDKIESSTS